MLKITEDFVTKKYNIQSNAFEIYKKALDDVKEKFKKLDEIREYNQFKVLSAFQEERISDSHFTNTTGYAYDDMGRDGLDKVYARVFNTEAAIVRPHFVNGTHAIGTALFGNLRPGDTLLAISGTPYDTLHDVIGLNGKKGMGSLIEYGINYSEVDLIDEKDFDLNGIKEAILKDPTIKMVHIQRSTGYSTRSSLKLNQIKEALNLVKSLNENIIVFVDNCYGEFVDVMEPTDFGADLMAGSLIKNIGGGISPTGGYIVGKRELVENASFRLTVPGIGGECGATLGVMRTLLQGFFLAPHVTIEAVKSSIFCARVMELAGFNAKPASNEDRTDIVQTVIFNNKEKLIEFIKGIQQGSPIDSFVHCIPTPMPGYEDEVIMAAGAFIQGSSIELSADAPIREPYIAYIQGGLTFDHAKIGILIALNRVLNN
ncbi:cystathionine beta-lyase family protein involved in aluminum resistance [Clostridium moniliforme]|uniref:Cystathionine beta-lyase family protein involved in aluminum resistance n=1 Tax=Clostridium moniliforme TaxID=39489 RepID=A0ABS4EWR6_9CLOT|nr:methionine gamma-lyase family protein [Clostridium moniliforme]MBP1888438.1 cystathionine beta-lyase family protein involved in aluminum resistance [Clostridium moniliforme]